MRMKNEDYSLDDEQKNQIIRALEQNYPGCIIKEKNGIWDVQKADGEPIINGNNQTVGSFVSVNCGLRIPNLKSQTTSKHKNEAYQSISKIGRLIDLFINEAEDTSIKSQNQAKMKMIINVANRCMKAYAHYGRKFTNDTELSLSKLLDDALEKLNRLDNGIEYDLRGITGVAPSSPAPSDINNAE